MSVLSTFSGARKFVSADSVVNPSPVSSDTTNNDLISSVASTLKDSATVIDQVASVARDALDDVRTKIAETAVTPAPEQPKIPSIFTPEDLSNSQRSIASDIASKVSPADQDVRSRVGQVAQDILQNSASQVVPTKARPLEHGINKSVPELESVTVDIDKKKGTVDSFYTIVKINLPLAAVSSGAIRLIRVFRKRDGSAPNRRTSVLSRKASDLLMADTGRNRKKNKDDIAMFDRSLVGTGVSSDTGRLSPVDGITGLRLGSDLSGSFSDIGFDGQTSDPVSAKNISSFLDPSIVGNIDRSVSADPKSLANLITQNQGAKIQEGVAPLRVGKLTFVDSASKIGSEALRQIRGSFEKKSRLVVQRTGDQGFEEVIVASPNDPGKIRKKIVGNSVELVLEDGGVRYGSSYSYYATTVDSEMNESARSRIVKVDIDGLRVPPSPKSLYATTQDSSVIITMFSDDELVEKFEVFRYDGGRERSVSLNTVLGKDGYVVQGDTRPSLPNGYLQIGEALNSSQAGSTFRDVNVVAGTSYDYRVYSVDIFGNKSERPAQTSVFVPDRARGRKTVERPVVSAENDPVTGKLRITISSDDDRAVAFFLARRDLSIGQEVFSPPGEVSFVKLGKRPSSSGVSWLGDVKLSDQTKDVSWNGFFQNDGNTVSFVDHVTEFDHTYQYRVFAVDRFGNKSEYSFSRQVFVSRSPVIASPTNISSSLDVGPDGVPTAVRLSWMDGNVDITSEDRIGNREDLRESSVRTLFQIERMVEGETGWTEFPMVEGTSFVDPVSNSEAPQFRPSYLKVGSRCSYRIAAFQTGSFVSMFSDPVSVDITAQVSRPERFRITFPDTKQRPFYVVLNWDTSELSAPVDRWEIERAEVNNIAAARLNVGRPEDFSKLSFKPFRTVYLESSRFRERADDIFSTGSGDLFVGQHHYLDMSVVFGNSYYYRIRALPPVSGSPSPWIYRGVKVTDDVFEKKQDVLITQEEKRQMATDLSPVVMKSNYLTPTQVLKSSAYSLVPSYVRSSLGV